MDGGLSIITTIWAGKVLSELVEILSELVEVIFWILRMVTNNLNMKDLILLN